MAYLLNLGEKIAKLAALKPMKRIPPQSRWNPFSMELPNPSGYTRSACPIPRILDASSRCFGNSRCSAAML